MTDWASTISGVVTGAGTLVLAVATFASVRSGNRSARTAERSLAMGSRPVLFPTRLEDPPEKIRFVEGHWVQLQGGRASVEEEDGRIYLGFSLRNVGAGIAVLQSWKVWAQPVMANDGWDGVEQFRAHTRDLYVPANTIGFWQGALRDPADPDHGPVTAAIAARTPLTVDVLYSDHEGGQRAVTRFSLSPPEEGKDWWCSVTRHRRLEGPNPR